MSDVSSTPTNSTSLSPQPTSCRGWWPLLIVPASLVVLTLFLQSQRGPHWLGNNSDPDYAYLLNALAVATFHSPGHTDHPGTPVQILGALVLRVLHLLSGRGEFVTDVLGRPEFYLQTYHRALLLLYAGVLFLAGWVTVRASGSLVAAVCLQASPALSVNSLNALTRVMPEPLLLSAAALMGGMLFVHAAVGRQSHARRFAIAYGLVTGLAAAAKVTAIPSAVIPLVMLPGLRARGWYVLTAACSFFVWTTPMLPRYKSFAVWIFFLLTRTGKYGSDRTGLPDPNVYVQSIGMLAVRDVLFVALLVLSAGLLVREWLQFRKQRGLRSIHGLQRPLLAVVIAQSLQILLVAKHPDSRYLVPGLGLLGVQAGLIFVWLLPSIRRNPLGRAAVAAAVIAAAVLQANAVRMLHTTLTTYRDAHQAVAVSRQRRDAAARTVYYYGASATAYALQFGDSHCRHLFAATLDTLYPHALFYDIWEEDRRKQTTSFAGPVDPVLIIANGETVLFQGRPFRGTYQSFRPLELKLTPVYENQVEALYRAESVEPSSPPPSSG